MAQEARIGNSPPGQYPHSRYGFFRKSLRTFFRKSLRTFVTSRLCVRHNFRIDPIAD